MKMYCTDQFLIMPLLPLQASSGTTVTLYIDESTPGNTSTETVLIDVESADEVSTEGVG